jgi:hypothetical protein
MISKRPNTNLNEDDIRACLAFAADRERRLLVAAFPSGRIPVFGRLQL